MKRKYLLFAMLVYLVFALSCKGVQPVCKSSVMKPVVFQKDSVTFYTVNIPFCDTVLLTPKKKK